MVEEEYVFGANIIENITVGMYQNPMVIFREYIQNSCDQIDKAIETGLITKNEAHIEIWLDTENRQITIEDNATGISHSNLKKLFVHFDVTCNSIKSPRLFVFHCRA